MVCFAAARGTTIRRNSAAYRNNNGFPDNRNNNRGFRVALGWRLRFSPEFAEGHGSGEHPRFVPGRSRRSWPGQVVCARNRRSTCLGFRATGAAVPLSLGGGFYDGDLFGISARLDFPLTLSLSPWGEGSDVAPKWSTPCRSQSRQNGPAIEAHFHSCFGLGPRSKLPARSEFLLGDRIQKTVLDVLEALIEATYTRERRSHLARANLGLQKLRFFFRLPWRCTISISAAMICRALNRRDRQAYRGLGEGGCGASGSCMMGCSSASRISRR